MSVPGRLVGISIVVLVVLAAAAGFYLRAAGDAAPEGDAGSEAVAAAVASVAGFGGEIAVPVAGAVVIRDTLVRWVRSSAQATASRQTVIHSHVSGPIQRLAVRENGIVSPGDLLLVIDPTEYELNVAEAQARVDQAREQFREMTLFDDRISDPAVRAERERVARVRSALESAEVALERAKLELERTRVVAPFRGRVASIRVVPGQWIRTGDELLSVVDLDPIRVEVQVLESEIGHMAPGRAARISFGAIPDTVFLGRIETINPIVERETRAAKVTVSIPNPAGRILPGMSARVLLEAQRYPDRILVPREAILERGERRPMLFVYEGDERSGRAKWRYVTPGLANEWHVEIVPDPETGMVEPGEIVLVDGHYTLIHDAPVQLVDDVRAAGGRPR